MAFNEYGEPVLTGNESGHAFAELLAEVIGHGLHEEFCGDGNPSIEVEAVAGFQPYIEVTLSNGATWQLTPVRSSWPTDGTSAQWADIEDIDAA